MWSSTDQKQRNDPLSTYIATPPPPQIQLPQFDHVPTDNDIMPLENDIILSSKKIPVSSPSSWKPSILACWTAELVKLSSILDHATFQVFNAYFKSGGDFGFNHRLLEAMMTVDNDIDTYLCGDLNFLECPEDTTSASPMPASRGSTSSTNLTFSTSRATPTPFTTIRFLPTSYR